MAIRNELMSGIDYAKGNVFYAVDENDTNDALISQGSAVNPTPSPIGSIVGWMKSFTGVPQTLPTGWIECDGSTISDATSPMDGEAVPNLNSGTKRFLRGSTTSGGTGGADSYTHTHAQGPDDGSPWFSGYGQVNSVEVSALPTYYEVVWIIRIK